MNTLAQVKIFKALSDENRLRILLHIQQATVAPRCETGACDPNASCVTELSSTLHITAPTVSHHIKELVAAGLITTTKKGRWVYCHINQGTMLELTHFIEKLREE